MVTWGAVADGIADEVSNVITDEIGSVSIKKKLIVGLHEVWYMTVKVL